EVSGAGAPEEPREPDADGFCTSPPCTAPPPEPPEACAAAGASPAGVAAALSCSSAALTTSCLRMRPPTPVPVSDDRSTPRSAASLRTSGVTYGEPLSPPP